LAQWFLRRRLKCEMLTDGRKVMAIAHMVYRPGELKRAITPKWVMGFTSKLQGR
jgi:hypothetical protein